MSDSVNGVTYTILVINDIDGPAYPERFELEVGNGGDTAPVLRYSQDGIGSGFTDLFIDLPVLVRLGDLARAIRDNDGPIPADQIETW